MRRIKSSSKNQGFNIDDLESGKSQNIMVGMLGKNKGVVIFVLGYFLLSIVSIIISFVSIF